MENKIKAGDYIRGKVIKNLLGAHERLAEKGNAKSIILLSKFLLKISKQFDNKLLYFRLEDCDESAKCPPQESENHINDFE